MPGEGGWDACGAGAPLAPHSPLPPLRRRRWGYPSGAGHNLEMPGLPYLIWNIFVRTKLIGDRREGQQLDTPQSVVVLKEKDKIFRLEMSERRKRTARAAFASKTSRSRMKRSGGITMRTATVAPPRTGGFFGTSTKRGRMELKTIDSGQVVTNPLLTTGTVVLLDGVATGTDFTNRIGRKVNLASVYLRGDISYTATTADGGVAVRVMIVYDTQTNGAAPVVTDILTASTVTAPNNLNNRDRFKTLMDKVFQLPGAHFVAAALTVGSPQSKTVKKYKRLNHEVIFGGTAATVGSIQTGGLFLVMIADTVGASFMVWDSRVRFEDA